MAEGTVTLAPKGPRVDRARGRLEVAELKAAIMALPLPPAPTNTRTYPTHTILGRVMRLKGLRIEDVVRLPVARGEMPSARSLSNYLAGRRPVSTEAAKALGEGLGVDWRVLV